MQAPIGVLACWRAEAAWTLAIRDYKDLAWALTREWALSIHAGKISIWGFTREWALTRDTTVDILFFNGSSCLILQLVESFLTHKDQILKLDMLTGNSISNPKFHFVY